MILYISLASVSATHFTVIKIDYARFQDTVYPFAEFHLDPFSRLDVKGNRQT